MLLEPAVPAKSIAQKAENTELANSDTSSCEYYEDLDSAKG